MVQAFINISEHANRIISIIKAQYGLNDKSQAIEMMAEKYEEDILEPKLRPEYVKKAIRIQKQKPIRVGAPQNLRTMIGLR
ncbi:MAG TPA: DUF2683 family protein [Candidatus Nanoarchaeia archaeon]|nr:DUF2683 family protein [Candidatus Nanoarchaeia archaeon]